MKVNIRGNIWGTRGLSAAEPHLLCIAAPQRSHMALVVCQHPAECGAKVLVKLDNLLMHSTKPARCAKPQTMMINEKAMMSVMQKNIC
jgi:hypothetical protein